MSLSFNLFCPHTHTHTHTVTRSDVYSIFIFAVFFLFSVKRCCWPREYFRVLAIGSRRHSSFLFLFSTDHISVYAFNMFRYLVFMFPNELLLVARLSSGGILLLLLLLFASLTKRFFFFSFFFFDWFIVFSSLFLGDLYANPTLRFFFSCHERNFVNCFNLFLNGAS